MIRPAASSQNQIINPPFSDDLAAQKLMHESLVVLGPFRPEGTVNKARQRQIIQLDRRG
ncbi:MAG: hypothetical protein K0R17_2020 [Rariglobus sp.]|nr:hypothetical protein [Rariglobus sp.]